MKRSGPLRTAKCSSRTMNEPGETSISRAVPFAKWTSSAPVNTRDRSTSSGAKEVAGDAGSISAEGAGDAAPGDEGVGDGVASAATAGGASSTVLDRNSGEPRYQPRGPTIASAIAIPTSVRPG